MARWGWEAVSIKADGAEDVQRGVAFYSGIGAITLGVASVGLFSAYFILGRSMGGGDGAADQDGLLPPGVEVIPTPNGFAVRF